MEAKLLVVGGKANRSEVALNLPMLFGRSPDVDMIIDHKTVSRRHCEVYELDGALAVRDDGSLNGILVDGQPVREAILKPGSKLTIGPLTFQVEYAHTGEFPALPEGGSRGGGGQETVLLGMAETQRVQLPTDDQAELRPASPVAEPAATSDGVIPPADLGDSAAEIDAADLDGFDLMLDDEFGDEGSSADVAADAGDDSSDRDSKDPEPEPSAMKDTATDDADDFLKELGLS